jgi:secreted Zn-dependent insulinase-like peptidase
MEPETVEVQKSSRDKREYDAFVLENGIKVVLVSGRNN